MDPYLSQIPSGGGDGDYLQGFRAKDIAARNSASAQLASASAGDPVVTPDSGEAPANPDWAFGKEGITFHDVLEMFNPLQHLPIIGTLYREITGDEAKPGVKLIGGLLFGGPTGLIAAGINNAIEFHTGHDIGGEVVALVTGRPMVTDEARARVAAYAPRGSQAIAGNAPAEATVQLASNTPAPIVAADTALSTASPAAAQTAAMAPAATPAKGSIGLPAGSTLSGPALTAPASVAASFPGNAMPAGLSLDTTGLTGKSGLPSPGMITPAAIVSMLGQPQQAAGRGAGVSPTVAAALPVAASIGGAMVSPPPTQAQQEADQAAQQKAAEATAENAAPSLRMPARQSIEPRLPGPAKNSGLRTPIIVPPDAVAAAGATGAMASPASDAPIILGTPNAAPAALTPTAQIPDAMLRALDKYDALIKNRHGGGKMVDQAT